MGSPAQQIAAAFPTFAARCAGGRAECLVTVRSIHPDTGATLATAEGVTALKRSRRRQPFGVGEGELSADSCRFILLASEVADAETGVAFFPKQRDEVVDADGVTTWHMDNASAIAFGTLFACDVTLKRG